MKRSILYQLDAAGATDGARRWDGPDLETLVAEVALAEQLGVDTVWCLPSLGDQGEFVAEAPEIWLAALAQRTSRLRLGWGLAGLTAPARPPLREAEKAASLDVASEGRLTLGLIPHGPLVDDAEEGAVGEGGTDRVRPDWQEGYRMLVDMWDRARFSWTSERFEVRPVDVVPKPVQQPHPPLWLIGWSETHARCAGAGGLGFFDVSGGLDAVLELHRDAYAAARAACDPLDLVSEHAFAVLTDLDPGAEGEGRIAELAQLAVDQIVLRLAPLERGHDQALERIRFLTEATADLH